ncbi:probable voltage-dependent N-type calcium channel subunit alpha-1B isoform X4 [Hydra vulgaris]|uniref:Probable voltage-dependent N-type calcium channel subunit alpha-1B isoform X4 n=1 Tax=Hydra vulgaris TaxID=6087 RepID=A0ABM4C6M4_HYDVU
MDNKKIKVDQNPITLKEEYLYPTNHLYFLSPTNPLRRMCVAILHSKIFKLLVIFTILLNCIVMALSSPHPKSDRDAIDNVLEHIDVYILGVFCSEEFLKIISQGLFMHKHAYLRNPWNILDLTFIVTGILPLVLKNNNKNTLWMRYIKMIRVLRPLKFVTKFESLQVLFGTIMKSLALLFHVCILTCFVISMYAIVGMSLLKGKFHYTCFLNSTNEIWKKGFLCGVDGQQCPNNTFCERYWLGPNSGAISFDNFISSCITVFVCITCEGWIDIMYKTFDVKDFNGNYYWFYYYTLEIIGAHFIMNLVCGVLCGGFSKERTRISNHRKFLALKMELETEQLSEKYVNWIDQGQNVLDQEKVEKKSKLVEKEEGEKELIKECDVRYPHLTKCMNLNSGVRIALKRILLSLFFYWLIMGLTFFNALLLIIQHYNEPQLITDITGWAQKAFMVFFTLEVILKLYALGPQLYFSKLSDKFEFVVITLWLFDFFLLKYAGFNFAFFVLHQLQLNRLFQHTRVWGSIKKLKTSIFYSISSVLSLILLFFIAAVSFALLGMSLFGAVWYNIVPKPRTNFDDFFNSMLTVFQIMMGDGWNNVMYDAIKANGGAEKPLALLSSLYFIVVTIVGNYVLINIFLAIALDNISLAESANKETVEKETLNLKENENFNQEPNQSTNPLSIEIPEESHGHKVIPKPDSEKLLMEVNTLFICFPNNPLRKIAHKVVNAQSFTNLTLFLIVISSGMLSLEDATNPDAKINKVLKNFDIAFTIYFTFEVLLKVINFGFCFHNGAYCREIWNCFDLFIVLTSIISVVLSMIKSTPGKVKSFLKILRLLRAFRCLKSVNNIPKLKLIIQCIGSSIKNATGIMAAILQCYFIFAVMGVQLFQGQLNYCTDESKIKEKDCRGFFISFDESNYNFLVKKERVWKKNNFNFNHFGFALLSLISSSSGERWSALMQSGVDSKGVDEGPLRNNKIWLSLYFIAFLITTSFFLTSLFVGMIVYTFKKKSGEIEGELDRNSINSIDFVIKSKPRPRFMPNDVTSLKYKVWALIESRCWEIFIVLMVSLNSAAMLMEFDGQKKEYENIMNWINNVLIFVFVLEAAIKIFALRCNYFKDFWNLFDSFIVFVGLLDFVMTQTKTQGLFDTSIFSLFRAFRFIKLMQRVRPIRILIWTFLKSLQALPYLGGLICILFYIYAVIGMQLFSLISISHNDDDVPWSYINKRNNFRTFLSSLQVLFRITSGENWPDIMLACTKNAKCDKELKAVQPDMETCGSDVAYFYFISFILLCYYLMLNLILAVIMDNFSYLTDDSSKLGPHHLDEVVMVWSDFDPRATGRIKHTEVIQLLKEMMPPVGLGPYCIKVLGYKRLVQMNMILYDDGSVDFNGFFFALVRTALNIYTKKDAKQMTIGKIYAAKLIIYNYRNIVQSNA